MKYTSNSQIKDEIKKILIDEQITFTDVSNKLDISRQQLNNTFNKSNLSFDDINKICDIIGYDLDIKLIKRK